MTLRFAANISLLFTEQPILERPQAAKDAGFDTVESWWPFDEAVPDARDVDAFVTAIADAGVRLEALNFYAGTMPAGERGVVSLPGRVEQFRESAGVLQTIAAHTGCTLFNALYGVRDPAYSPDEQDATAAENLAFAAETVAPIGGTVLLEALAEGENGSYPLTTPDQVIAVIDRVRAQHGSPNLRLLADFYHYTRNGFTWQTIVEDYLIHAGHIQIADSPGRHQPGTGEIDFAGLFEALDANDWPGCVGLEYRPEGSTTESLAWLSDPAYAMWSAV